MYKLNWLIAKFFILNIQDKRGSINMESKGLGFESVVDRKTAVS